MDEPQYKLNPKVFEKFRYSMGLERDFAPLLKLGAYEPMKAVIITKTKLKITDTEWKRDLFIESTETQAAIVTVNHQINHSSVAAQLTKEQAVEAGKHLCKLGGLDVQQLQDKVVSLLEMLQNKDLAITNRDIAIKELHDELKAKQQKPPLLEQLVDEAHHWQASNDEIEANKALYPDSFKSDVIDIYRKILDIIARLD